MVPVHVQNISPLIGVSLNYLESRSGIRALNFLWTADKRHHHHRQTQPVIAIGSRMDGFEPQKWHNLPFVVCQKLCRTPPLWSKMIKWYQINTTTDMINHVCKFWICLDQPIFGSMAVHDSPWHSHIDLQTLIMPEPLSMTTGWLAMTLARSGTGRPCTTGCGWWVWRVNQASSYSRSIGQNSVDIVFSLHLLLHAKQSYGCTFKWYVAATQAVVKNCIAYHVSSTVFRTITKHVKQVRYPRW